MAASANQPKHHISVIVKNQNESLLTIIHEYANYAFHNGQFQVYEGDAASPKVVVYAEGFWQSATLEEVKQ